MNEIESIEKYKEIEPYITGIREYPKMILSLEMRKILGKKYEPHSGYRLTLINGYEISVVKGFGTYSGPGTVEVAVFTPENEWYMEDKVMGHVSEEEFVILVQTIGSLKKELTQGETPA
jgi:hypothetical protein